MNKLFDELLTEIKKLKQENLLIIVEGNNDKISLEKLGLHNVYSINKRAMYKIIDDAKEYEEVIILTDLDNEGKKLYKVLSVKLNELGVKVNNKFRHFLFKHTSVRQVEGLFSYMQRLDINRYEM